MPTRSLAERVLGSPLVARLYESRLWRRSPLVALLLGISLAREQAAILAGARLEGRETVLDLACGTGLYARAFARHLPAGRVVGVDRAAAMLREARRRAAADGIARLPLVRADAGVLPFRTASFDRVHCGAALHLFRDLERALAEMRRVLRPGGILTATVIEGRGRLPRLIAGLRRALGVATLSGPALASRLRDAGFPHVETLARGRGWLLLRSRA